MLIFHAFVFLIASLTDVCCKEEEAVSNEPSANLAPSTEPSANLAPSLDQLADVDVAVDGSIDIQQQGKDSDFWANFLQQKNQLYGSDIGVLQTAEGDTKQIKQVLARIKEGQAYMQLVQTDDTYELVRDICKNEHHLCAWWAVEGQCERNKVYMQTHCAPMCQACEMLHVMTRCPRDVKAQAAVGPGDLNAIFERIVTDPYYQKYEPIVLSRPTYAPGDTPETATYRIGMWIVTLEQAVSGKEAQYMIDLGNLEGFTLSGDVIDDNEDGTFTGGMIPGRTSSNAWCKSACLIDPTTIALSQRLSNLTGIPKEHSEVRMLVSRLYGTLSYTHALYMYYLY
jgi:prolyl 4-hydroxylase